MIVVVPPGWANFTWTNPGTVSNRRFAQEVPMAPDGRRPRRKDAEENRTRAWRGDGHARRAHSFDAPDLRPVEDGEPRGAGRVDADLDAAVPGLDRRRC